MFRLCARRTSTTSLWSSTTVFPRLLQASFLSSSRSLSHKMPYKVVQTQNIFAQFSISMLIAVQTISASKAAELDKELMSEAGGFSIDQLMELAGLSCSQAGTSHPKHAPCQLNGLLVSCQVYKVHPPSNGKNILIACGPGNNGMRPSSLVVPHFPSPSLACPSASLFLTPPIFQEATASSAPATCTTMATIRQSTTRNRRPPSSSRASSRNSETYLSHSSPTSPRPCPPPTSSLTLSSASASACPSSRLSMPSSPPWNLPLSLSSPSTRLHPGTSRAGRRVRARSATALCRTT